MDILGKSHGVENRFYVSGKEAGIGALEQELKAEESVGPRGWGRVREPEFDAGRKVLGETLVEILERELSQALVAALAGEQGSVREGWEIELVPEFEFLGFCNKSVAR